ncbi:MAG: YlxM family DNA-binding protein [Clostridiales bacterium]|nr:YlxM family DNA-binding protein [Clostridiales bacterium]
MIMELSEKNRFSLLYDFYAPMLTQRQADIMQFYYADDLSLQEIAENTGLSRQGVRDAIKKSEKILIDCESKLGLYQKYLQQKADFDLIVRQLEQFGESKMINDIIKHIRNMIL